MENNKESFEEALARFILVNQQAIDAHYQKDYPGLWASRAANVEQLSFDPKGVKYVRIVGTRGADSNHRGSRSVFCFVEVSTGNVLKADGWKKPAKGARGSIYAATYEGYGTTVYGAKYINR